MEMQLECPNLFFPEEETEQKPPRTLSIDEKRQLVKDINNWLIIRKKTINNLEEIIEALEKKTNDTNIAEVSGASVGLVGAGLTIAGLVTLPLTFGLSAPLAFAGLAVGVAGGVTGAGAGFVNYSINKTKGFEAAQLLVADRIATKLLRQWDTDEDVMEDEYDVQAARRQMVADIIREGSTTVGKSLKDIISVADAGTELAVTLGKGAIQAADDAVNVGSKAAATPTKALATTGAKALHGVAWAGCIVGALLDVRTLIYKSRHIHLYKKKRKDKTTEESDEDEEESDNADRETKKSVGNKFTGFFTDPFLDMTISDQAEHLAKHVKKLKGELKAIETDELIQLRIKEYG